MAVNLNINNTADTLNYDVIPEGTVLKVRIINTEEKPTQSNGVRIVVTFEVIQGEKFAGRKIYESYNVVLPGKPDAEKIGKRMLGNLAYACGLSELMYAEQLINGVLQIKVSVDHSEQYGDRNVIAKNGLFTFAGDPLKRPAQQSTVPTGAVDDSKADEIPW